MEKVSGGEESAQRESGERWREAGDGENSALLKNEGGVEVSSSVSTIDHPSYPTTSALS